MDKTIKAASGTTAFQYNQKAHKKYTSQRSLVDRILKSHSEGNRFIRNDDLWKFQFEKIKNNKSNFRKYQISFSKS